MSDVGTAGRSPLRLAELVAALSLATDLGSGQPLEHALRTCLLSVDLARSSGVGDAQLSDVYYLALLRFVGCTADAAETATQVGGDDLSFIGALAPHFMGSLRGQVGAILRAAGADQPLPRRVAAIAAVLSDTGGAERSIAAHCEAAQLLAARLGVGGGVTTALSGSFERWDGKGIPGLVAAADVPAPVRVVVVAHDVELWLRLGGIEAAVEVVRQRRGHAYDPVVADAFCAQPEAFAEAIATADVWEAALEAEPAPWVRIADDKLEAALSAFADFTDLKSPWLRGHSSKVSALAADAARRAGLDDDAVRDVRLAGLVHDIGRVGITNGVWDTPRPLSIDEWERVHLHPYLTERVLRRSPRLSPLARLAGSHHERGDGSGYHRGVPASELSLPQQVLAAADVYTALTEDRPHRKALTSDDACAVVRDEGHGGRLDTSAVEAVVEAAGHEPAPPGHRLPAGLTEREVEVLRLIARGRSNREVAAELVISPKTAGTHIEHIYAKAGVSTRAGAALFAMEHGLL